VRVKLFVIITAFLSITILANNEVKNMIIPTPQVIKLTNKLFKISDGITIGVKSDKTTFIGKQILESLKNSFGVNGKIVKNNAQISLNIVDKLKNVKTDKVLYKQAYNLIITEKNITINAVSEKGLFYGAMSLIQLLENNTTKELPTFEISDWPDLQFRGISDDISRGQVSTMQNFKRIIDFIARYKMNVYMPYMEDMLQLKSYPSIGKNRGALSTEEVKEIVNYASERYIEVIPIFQTLGHFENILTSKEFVDFAEFPGAASLSVTEEKTYVFIENMLNEVFALFPSEYINIGADESYDVGFGKSKELTEKVGVAKIHAEHYKKVFEICKKNNRKVMMYGDVILNHTDILDLIPKDVTIIDWHYGANKQYSSTDIFKEAGFQFIVSPSVWNYRSVFPTYQIALPNIKTIVNDGMLNGAKGMINSNWGDYGAETFKEFVLFGYAWSAQCSWNYDQSSLSDFNNAFFADFFGIDVSKLNSLYKTFSTIFNQPQWHELWRHPALELPTAAWWAPRINPEEISSWMNWSLPDAFNTIENFENLVTKNKDHFELLRFIIYLDFYYSKKMETNYYITSLLKLKKLESESAKSKEKAKENKIETITIKKRLSQVKIDDLITQNITELKNLKLKYQELWLKYYKKDNLNMILDKFDRLISYFEETKTAIKNNSLKNPTIESDWIYANASAKTSYEKAEFKHIFTIKDDIKSANIQLIADTHGKLYINDNFVGEIYSRRSLSLLTEYDRFLLLDAKKYFTIGENAIRIEAQSYKGDSGAGVNFIAEIVTTNETLEILSDSKWESRELNSNQNWEKSTVKDYKFPIIAPNFTKKRTSWIER